MSLVLHHMHYSQSERIVWLLEELSIPYTLKLYTRAPILSPAHLKALPGNALGTAPVLQVFHEGDATDGSAPAKITLAESGAIVEYLLTKYGKGSTLAVSPDAEGYGDYLYWLHAANGSLQPQVGRLMALASLPSDNPSKQHAQGRVQKILELLDEQLKKTGAFIAGSEVTAADCMVVFSLTTMRYFSPFGLEKFPNVLAYLKRVGEREVYRRAMEKGDEGMELLLGPEPPKKTFFEMQGGWR